MRVVFMMVLRKLCAERMRTNTLAALVITEQPWKQYCVHLRRANSSVTDQFTSINEQWSVIRWLADEPNLIIAERNRRNFGYFVRWVIWKTLTLDNTLQNQQKSKHIFKQPTDDEDLSLYMFVVYNLVIVKGSGIVVWCEIRLFLLCFGQGCCLV